MTTEAPSTHRASQKQDESAMEFLRRAVSNLDYETETLLDSLPSVGAILDYFDLWKTYDTDFWEGIVDGIENGENPEPALAFIKKHGLSSEWADDVTDAVKRANDEGEEDE